MLLAARSQLTAEGKQPALSGSAQLWTLVLIAVRTEATSVADAAASASCGSGERARRPSVRLEVPVTGPARLQTCVSSPSAE